MYVFCVLDNSRPVCLVFKTIQEKYRIGQPEGKRDNTEGGYVFTPVCLYDGFLFVWLHKKQLNALPQKHDGKMRCTSGKNPLNVGVDQNQWQIFHFL